MLHREKWYVWSRPWGSAPDAWEKHIPGHRTRAEAVRAIHRAQDQHEWIHGRPLMRHLEPRICRTVPIWVQPVAWDGEARAYRAAGEIERSTVGEWLDGGNEPLEWDSTDLQYAGGGAQPVWRVAV